MCYDCTKNFSNDEIKKQLLDALERKEFSIWNSTSISNLFLITVTSSEECQKLALQLLQEYKNYKNYNK